MVQQQKINTIVMVLVITMATHYGSVMAQFSECATEIASMTACANFLANPTSTASSACCSEFSSLIQSQPLCLCQVFNSTASFMGLNELPKICNVVTPRECYASPSDSPLSETTPPPPGTTPSPGTNATSPPADGPPSDATSTRYTTFPVLCLLLVAAYAMVF